MSFDLHFVHGHASALEISLRVIAGALMLALLSLVICKIATRNRGRISFQKVPTQYEGEPGAIYGGYYDDDTPTEDDLYEAVTCSEVMTEIELIS